MLYRLRQALRLGKPRSLVTLVPVKGVIAATQPGRRSVSADSLESALVKAFRKSGTRAVVLSINSPGGSPVQSRAIMARARELSARHNVPVIAHVEELGASGGYMVALAGDEVYADPFAIVGSVGVVAGGFGFPDAIARLGVERRVYTAGQHKAQLDPFKEEDPHDVARLQTILDASHGLFIDVVRERRGNRLNGDDAKLFEGDFYIASEARELGLIDGVEGLRDMLTRRFGEDVQIRQYGPDRRPSLSRFLSGVLSSAFGPETLVTQAGDGALWARFGK